MENAPLALLVPLASYILGISFFAYVTASISNFLDENLEEGKIFEFYGKWVRKEVWINNEIEELERQAEYNAANPCSTYTMDVSYVTVLPEKVKVPKWKKPLGACVYCANTWVNIILMSILIFSRWSFSWKVLGLLLVNIIVASALSNTFLRKING